jgi:ATP-dependent Clp protease adaptor protein ClpS
MSKPGFDLESKKDIEHKTKEPKRYKVILHNDDYTTMEFVIEVLMYVFGKTESEATLIMLNVHRNGLGICGIFTAEIAETKVSTVTHEARKRGYPLKCTMEEV